MSSFRICYFDDAKRSSGPNNGNPGKDYGLLTLTTSYYAHSELLMNVSQLFLSLPKADSAVLRRTPRQERIKATMKSF